MNVSLFLFSDWRGDRDTAWARGYYHRFGRELYDTLPKTLADSSAAIRQFLGEATNAYGDRKIQPEAFITARYLAELLRLISESNAKSNFVRHVLAECCKAFVRVAQAPDRNMYLQVREGVLAYTRYLELQAVWKALFTFCFHEFQPARRRCIYESTSLDEWRNSIVDLYPLLLLVEVAPTYELSYADKLQGEDTHSKTSASGPFVRTNMVKTPSLLFKKSFTEVEVQTFQEENKVIDETVANVHRAAAIIDNRLGVDFLTATKKRIMEVGLNEGYNRAREEVIIAQTLRMSIPAFIAEELARELRARTR